MYSFVCERQMAHLQTEKKNDATASFCTIWATPSYTVYNTNYSYRYKYRASALDILPRGGLSPFVLVNKTKKRNSSQSKSLRFYKQLDSNESPRIEGLINRRSFVPAVNTVVRWANIVATRRNSSKMFDVYVYAYRVQCLSFTPTRTVWQRSPCTRVAIVSVSFSFIVPFLSRHVRESFIYEW